jgi:hypothetical protein
VSFIAHHQHRPTAVPASYASCCASQSKVVAGLQHPIPMIHYGLGSPHPSEEVISQNMSEKAFLDRGGPVCTEN